MAATDDSLLIATMPTTPKADPKERRPIEADFSVKEETSGGINTFDTKQVKSKIGLVADSELPVIYTPVGSMSNAVRIASVPPMRVEKTTAVPVGFNFASLTVFKDVASISGNHLEQL